MEQSLADRDDGEDLIEAKVGGVHSTDSQLQPSQVYLYFVIWELACCLCGKTLTSERIDAL